MSGEMKAICCSKSKSDKVRDFIEETSDKECQVIHLKNETISFLSFLYTKHN